MGRICKRSSSFRERTQPKAAADAKVVMDVEIQCVKFHGHRKRRDLANLNHNMTPAELRALTLNFSWDDYLTGIRLLPRPLSGRHA